MSALIDLAVRAVVLLALAWVGTTLLRRRSASVRASIWTGALAAVLALPMVAVLVPAWRVPIWPAPSAPAVEVSAAVIPAPAMAPAVLLNDSTSTRLPAEAPAPPVISSSSTDRTETVLLALAAITLLLMARVAVSHLRMMRIAKQAQDAGAEWSTLVDRMRRDLQIARNVPVRKTDATNVPAVAGIWRPVLLLPIDTTDWPPDVRRAVVLHELAHVVRWDAVASCSVRSPARCTGSCRSRGTAPVGRVHYASGQATTPCSEPEFGPRRTPTVSSPLLALRAACASRLRHSGWPGRLGFANG